MRGIFASVLAISLLAGCSLPGLGGKDDTSNTPQTLKVLYYDEQSFYQEYGMLYSALNPNVEIEVISTNNIYDYSNPDQEKTYEEAYAEFVEEQKPDVIITESYSMPALLKADVFYDLDAFVNQESYDLQGLGTAVVDSMKELGNGILYGIPTSVQSQVIYYNKDVFDEHGVPHPTDNMTWSEIITLANMFPTEGEYPDRVYGLRYGYTSSLADVVMQMANAEGLKNFDEETLTMTIDTPAWKQLVEQAAQLYNSGALYNDQLRWEYTPDDYTNYDHYALEPLLNGIVAMSYESSYYLQEIKYAKQYAQNPENLTDNWDIVSSPVGSGGNNQSSGTYYNGIMTIYKNSTNVETAWDFVSYVTGDDYARVKSFSSYGNLPIRKKYALQDSDKNVEAFYATKPIIDSSVSYDYSKIPQRFSNEFYSVQYEEFQKLQDGTATVDEVLAALQLRGNELLATGVMSQEELDEYYNDFYSNNNMNFVGEGVMVEGELEETVEEVLE